MFDPTAVARFHFVSHAFDEATGVASFEYAFDTGERFTETFGFPLPDSPLTEARRAALSRVLFLLSLAAGVSYYKAAVPPLAIIESGDVTEGEAAFLRDLLFHGLGEFAYVNDLDLRDRPKLEFVAAEERSAIALDLERRSLVAVGGGKDSCVSIETLRAGHEPMMLASIRRAKPILDVIEVAQLPSVHVERSLSPELIRINTIGAYNGHVPITAIVSLALVATALITGCDTVVMSNERSASVGNVDHLGVNVNHQYSKSFDAEQALNSLLHASVSPTLTYFSLLRPLSELDIVRRFSTMTKYHPVFTSCNRAFTIDPARRIDHWCCDCPKCRFVYLALAPFVEPGALQSIFGVDMLDNLNQSAGFDALIGWQANKPFECVGEVEESVAGFLMLAQQDAWRGRAVVKRFVNDVLPILELSENKRNELLAAPFVEAAEHAIPAQYLEMLNATG